MKILNYGSLNVDHVYQVKEICRPGETISSYEVNLFPGGKGMNQSVALARAGAQVYHAGMIGEDGLFLKKLLEESGADCRFLKTIDVRTGNAFIQVDAEGQNCIVLYGGANQQNTKERVDEVLSFFEKGDVLLLQNEVNELAYLIDKAYEKGMTVVLNPSPMDEKVLACDLQHVSIFMMNEHEAAAITGCEDEARALQKMKETYPKAEIIMTLGGRGSVYSGKGVEIHQEAMKVKAVDTTAAGDTFTGFYLACYAKGLAADVCLEVASKAAAIAVTRKGAAASIPAISEVI